MSTRNVCIAKDYSSSTLFSYKEPCIVLHWGEGQTIELRALSPSGKVAQAAAAGMTTVPFEASQSFELVWISQNHKEQRIKYTY